MGKFQTKVKHNKKVNKNVKKSRKDIRKEQRQLKKVHRNDYYSKKNKHVGKFVKNPDFNNLNSSVSENEIKLNKKTKSEAPADKIMAEQQKDKKRQEILEKEMTKKRCQQLRDANEIEEKGIKKLEKQLKLNRKSKNKSIPKSFAEDGLDYLLELCDSDKLATAAKAEQKLLGTKEDDFNKDYEIAMGKSMTKVKFNTDIDSDSENDNQSMDLSDQDSELGGDIPDDELGNTSDENFDMSDDSNSDYLEDIDEHEFNDLSLEPEESDYDSEDVDDEIVDAYLGLGEFPDGIFRPENLSPVFEETGSDLEDYDKGVNTNRKLQLKYNQFNNAMSTSCGDESDEDSSEPEISNYKTNIGKRKADSKESKGKSKKIKTTKDEPTSMSSDDSGDESMESDCSDSEAKVKTGNNENDTWEDIYGRTRDKEGNIIKNTGAKYIPPQARAKMVETATSEKVLRLKRQMKGLLNRVAENNMLSIASEIDGIYMVSSRHETNDALVSLSIEALVKVHMTTDLMIAHHTMLIAILHANVGSEVGAYYLQTLIKKFDDLLSQNQSVENKTLDNVVSILANLYNFKVYPSALLLDILKELSKKISEKTLECVLVILRVSGFFLRKDDPGALKDFIIALQGLANEAPDDIRNNSRLKFMMDVLFAIKNNNVSKIPLYDPAPLEHLRKTLRGLLRKGNYVTPINVSYADLLNADERGRWWVVGSAWSGDKLPETKNGTNPKESAGAYSDQLLELAKSQRMNTDIRRNIFCAIMSSEDNTDALEKVLHLGLKGSQEREIAYVLLNCCLQETPYNPFYSILAAKFCNLDRKYQMSHQCAIWDKIRDLTSLSSAQSINLAKFLTYLIAEKSLAISVLKVIEFSELQKLELRLVRQILLGIFLNYTEEDIKEVFQRVATGAKLKLFRQGLRLFLQHFLLGAKNNQDLDKEDMIRDKVNLADMTLAVGDSKSQY